MDRLDYFTLAFYVVNLGTFHLIILLGNGLKIKAKCHENFSCSRHLRLTWLNYYADFADGQWREFRGSLWLLWSCVILTVGVNVFIRFLCKQIATSAQNLRYRFYLQTAFRLIFAAVFMIIQHNYHSVIIILIAVVGFHLAKTLKGSKHATLLNWLYTIAVLLFKESYRVQHHPSFSFLQPLFSRAYGGLYGWQLPANFLALRLISFSLDYGRACRHHEKISNVVETPTVWVEEHPHCALEQTTLPSPSQTDVHQNFACSQLQQSNSPIKRSFTESPDHLDLSDYTFINFASYMFYGPLYMAGPIITFSDFMRCAKNTEMKDIFPWIYCARWLLCLALMELLLHYFPLFAVIKSGLFFELSPGEIASAAYTILTLMWLKFLLLWRFFRLWALADGINAPENMLRCVSNNYSLEQFWKGWHASFNKWIISYLYLPLGGRKNRKVSVWAVFFFVAVWHDIEWKLIVWGALNSLFLLVEILAKKVRDSQYMSNFSPSAMHLICSMCGAFYIMVLMTVNLIGYAVGVDGMSEIYGIIATRDGIQVILLSFYFLSVGTSFMIVLEESKTKCILETKEPSAEPSELSKARSE